MNPETRFAMKVDAELKKVPKSYWFNIQQAAIRGTPDRLGVVNGTFVGLELKRSKKEADKSLEKRSLQAYQLSQIAIAGGMASFLYPENLEKTLERLQVLGGDLPRINPVVLNELPKGVIPDEIC